MSQPVLLVIDMLNDFFIEGLLAKRRDELVRSINELVALFRSHNLPIIWIRQEFAPDLSDAFLVMRERGLAVTIAGTDGCEILPDLDCLPTDPVIVKKRYSAFFGTNLDEILASLQPPFIVIAGVNTHACVRMTAIDAYQRDYHVVIASECVASYDDDYHRDSMRYLGGRTRITTNGEFSRFLGNSDA